jgi:hypothetical protein
VITSFTRGENFASIVSFGLMGTFLIYVLTTDLEKGYSLQTNCLLVNKIKTFIISKPRANF